MKRLSKDLEVSVDTEADGPVPDRYSMLSLGAAAFDCGEELRSAFETNLETLPGALQHPDTMRW